MTMQAHTKSTLSWILILSTIAVVVGLKCRVDNDSQSVEEFEDMVRICLRSSISSQDKHKNKQAWSNKNNSRGNRGKNKHSSGGRFGRDSDEDDDDYEDDYGEESDNDGGKDKKKENKGNRKGKAESKGDSGGSKISTRFRRAAQYSYGRGYNNGRGYEGDYGDDDNRYNEQYPNTDMRGYSRPQSSYGYYRDRYGSNNEMNRRNYRRDINYNIGNDYDENNEKYKNGRIIREAQYQPDNRWNDGQNRGQRNREGMQGYGNQGNNGPSYSYGNYGGGYGNQNGNGGYGYDNRWSGSNFQSGNGKRNSTTGNKSSLQQVQPCIIHCILRQKRMLDEDSTPDKKAVMRVMTQNIKERELREFIQDSINECFDNIESDDEDGKCDMSKSLMVCLEEKGKQNCEDWDRAGPTTNPNKWFSNNKESRPTYQHRPPSWG